MITSAVALCTYNGERYIEQQLDSLVHQSKQPDEVVICDDCSSDSTVSIIQRWSQNTPFKIVFVQNEKNLGYAKNFEKAISLCTKDVIFLSDQDDIWDSQKLEKMLDVFQKHPEVGVVFCDGLCVDAQGTSLNLKNSEIAQAGMFYGRPYYLYWNSINKGMHFFGCCCAIRKSLWERIQPLPNSITHDLWIFLTASAISQIVWLDETLIHYRLHDNNSSNVTPQTSGKIEGEYIETFYKTSTGLFFYNSPMINDFTQWLLTQNDSVEKDKALMFFKHQNRHYTNRSRIQRNALLFFPLFIWEMFSGSYFHEHQPVRAMLFDIATGLSFGKE